MRRLEEYRMAIRAYRQIANALEGQGLKEEAELFTYRAQNDATQGVLVASTTREAIIMASIEAFEGLAVFLAGLSLVSGYGYRFERSLGCYLGVLFSFACFYVYLSQTCAPSFWHS